MVRAEAERLLKVNGKGFAILAEDINSPSVRLLRLHMQDKLKLASWHTYEPIDRSSIVAGTEVAFGNRLIPRYHFDKLDRILALDSDFLGMDPDQVANSRAFAGRRKLAYTGASTSRLFVVESAFSITGTMADHRLRLPASSIGSVLVAIAQELAGPLKDLLKAPLSRSLASIVPPSISNEKWIRAIVRDLADNPGKSLIVVGERQPVWVHALAHAVNEALGAYSARLAEFIPAPVQEKNIGELTKAMASGDVDTLLIIGGNPAFNAPTDLEFASALTRVAKKFRLGLVPDQTSALCDWHLPLAHYLEGWGDAEAADSSLCCVQPAIAPLNGGKPSATDLSPPARGGRTILEVLALFTQYIGPSEDPKINPPTTSFAQAKARANGLIRRAFSERSGIALTAPEFEAQFNQYKQLGYLPLDRDKLARKPLSASVDQDKVSALIADPKTGYIQPTSPDRDALEVNFVPDYSLHDGRFAINPWLQEFPDPITKLVWDNAAIISPQTAAAFQLTTGDRVLLTVSGSTIDVPVFILPGQADDTVTLPFGQSGQMPIAHIPSGGGFDVFPMRKSSQMWIATNAQLQPTGKRADLVTTQEHGIIPEGRDIIRDLPLAEYRAQSEIHKETTREHEPDIRAGFQGGYGNVPPEPLEADEKQRRFPLDLARPERLDSQFQWGMVIDLSACTGCGACVAACQSENNIPVVGKAEVKRNREMHWIRLDRYFIGPDTSNPRIVTQPVACVHCEQAPCEAVCPVNATVHSPEGLNLQVYNRCIGTRYCSNACPYKARRFNWFDFNKRRVDELYVPTPLASGGASLGDTGVPETLKMQKNPDVTVRMRGVMEKCTYCVQRIERAKIGANIAAAEVANGSRTITLNTSVPVREGSSYRKPKDPMSARYDLDAEGRGDRAGRHHRDRLPIGMPDAGDYLRQHP